MRDEFETDSAEGGALGGWRGRAVRRLSVWSGAAVAVAVVGGLAFWGYRLSQRDASEIPVLRAALTPAKVQPANPGGAEIAYTDITAYRAGSGDAVPTDIVFAPPPERPSPEDVAMAMMADGAAEKPFNPVIRREEGSIRDYALGDVAPQATPMARPRPPDLRQRMAAAKQALTEEAELARRAAASPVQIQLGAYPAREETERMWARVYEANEDILRGRALVIQSTISGGRRYFRLRAGPFRDRIEAQNVCRALQSRGQDCLVAVNG